MRMAAEIMGTKGGELMNATDEMTIYNLAGSVEYTVVCTTPMNRGASIRTSSRTTCF